MDEYNKREISEDVLFDIIKYREILKKIEGISELSYDTVTTQLSHEFKLREPEHYKSGTYKCPSHIHVAINGLFEIKKMCNEVFSLKLPTPKKKSTPFGIRKK